MKSPPPLNIPEPVAPPIVMSPSQKQAIEPRQEAGRTPTYDERRRTPPSVAFPPPVVQPPVHLPPSRAPPIAPPGVGPVLVLKSHAPPTEQLVPPGTLPPLNLPPPNLTAPPPTIPPGTGNATNVTGKKRHFFFLFSF